jgi:hypothetical protein
MRVAHWTARIQVAACMYRASNMLDNKGRVIRSCAPPLSSGSASGQARATLQGLDNLRRVAGLMGEGGPSAGRLGGLVQGQIDQFVNGLSPADIVGASDPAAAAASG